MSKLHLQVAGQSPVSVGRFGCDYHYPHVAAYYCLPHRWMPGSDHSYALWQAGAYADMDEAEAELYNQVPSVVRARKLEEQLARDARRELEEARRALEAEEEGNIPF